MADYNKFSRNTLIKINDFKDASLSEMDEEKAIRILIEKIADITLSDDVQIYRLDKETNNIYNYALIDSHEPSLLPVCHEFLRTNQYRETIYDDKLSDELTIFDIETEKNRYAVAVKGCSYIDEKIKDEGIAAAIEICKTVIPVKEYIKYLRELAYYDTLTGVYSRIFYSKYVDDHLGERKKYMTVSSVDLFRLNYINNNFDHIVGDKYIVTAANALKAQFEKKDKIFRTGGDEFIVITSRMSKDNVLERFKNVNLILNKAPLTLELNTPLLINYGVAEGYDQYGNLLKEAEEELKKNKDETYKRLGLDRRSQRKIT